MAKPKKLPSGNWNVTVFSHFDSSGKRVYKSFTDPDKKKVVRMAHEFQDSREKGFEREMTVEKALEEYISSKENVLSPSTIREYRRLQKKAYEPVNPIYISRITSKDLQYFVSDLSLKSSPKTVRNIYSLLVTAIGMHTDKKFRVTLPQKERLEYATPDDEEVRLLLAHASKELKLCIYLSAIGTLRRGEICALKYGDILKDTNEIYIHADMVMADGRKWVYKPVPKTSSSIRTVPLPEQIMDMIGDGPENEYIVNLNPDQITNGFIRLRNKLGLKCRFHDLRHYSATIRMYMGIPLKEIQAIGGWSNIDTLQKIYVNQLKSKSAEYTERANNYFNENLVEKNKPEEE